MNTIKWIAVVVVVVGLGGCLGRGGPGPVYLRLDDWRAIQARCEQHPRPGAPVVAMQEPESLPMLDRQALIRARGSVMEPSGQWQWEGTPAEMLGQSLASGLGCSQSFVLAWPYSPRLTHDAVLAVQVSAFELRLDGALRFEAAVRCELWSPNRKALVAARTFAREEPVSGLDPQAVAGAAGNAVRDLTSDVRSWLEANVKPVEVR